MIPRLNEIHPKAMEISAIVTVENIRINTERMLMKTSFNLTLTWLEPRVTYMNLKYYHALNTVNDKNLLWSPSISFTNTVDNKGTVVDDLTDMYVFNIRSYWWKNNSIPEEGISPCISQVECQLTYSWQLFKVFCL